MRYVKKKLICSEYIRFFNKPNSCVWRMMEIKNAVKSFIGFTAFVWSTIRVRKVLVEVYFAMNFLPPFI